jgi:hypothetical protein
MFDIIKCKAEAKKHSFEKLYSYEDVKERVVTVKTLAEAAEKRKQKKLLLVGDYTIDEGAVKLLGDDQKACILLDLSKIIKTYGIKRAIEMSIMRKFLEHCVKYGTFYAFATFAEKEEGIRTPDEMMHICALIGLNKGQAKFSLKMLKHYLE